MKKLDPNCLYIYNATTANTHMFHTDSKGNLAAAGFLNKEFCCDTFFGGGRINYGNNHWYDNDGFNANVRKIKSDVLVIHAFKMTREDIVNLWLES